MTGALHLLSLPATAPVDPLVVLKEYGLAGVMAWLFWWTLRRMMASHDSTVRGLKEQLERQARATQSVSDSFGQVVQNHMGHVTESLTRFDVSLAHYGDEQRRWQDRLLHTLDLISAHLGRKGADDGSRDAVGGEDVRAVRVAR